MESLVLLPFVYLLESAVCSMLALSIWVHLNKRYPVYFILDDIVLPDAIEVGYDGRLPICD